MNAIQLQGYALDAIYSAMERPGCGMLLAQQVSQDGSVALFHRNERYMIERDGVVVLTLEDKELAEQVFNQLVMKP